MRQQYVKYLKRQSLGLIPLYMERLQAIKDEITHKYKMGSHKKSEIDFLNELKK